VRLAAPLGIKHGRPPRGSTLRTVKPSDRVRGEGRGERGEGGVARAKRKKFTSDESHYIAFDTMRRHSPRFLPRRAQVDDELGRLQQRCAGLLQSNTAMRQRHAALEQGQDDREAGRKGRIRLGAGIGKIMWVYYSWPNGTGTGESPGPHRP